MGSALVVLALEKRSWAVDSCRIPVFYFLPWVEFWAARRYTYTFQPYHQLLQFYPLSNDFSSVLTHSATSLFLGPVKSFHETVEIMGVMKNSPTVVFAPRRTRRLN